MPLDAHSRETDDSQLWPIIQNDRLSSVLVPVQGGDLEQTETK